MWPITFTRGTICRFRNQGKGALKTCDTLAAAVPPLITWLIKMLMF